MTDRTESHELRAADEYRLAATLYRPQAAALAVVVIACATGVRRSYYDNFARALADQGLAVLTFDYRGIGDSRPAKLAGFTARMQDWGALDLDAALIKASELFPAAPLQVVGHSAGGQLIGLCEHADRITAIVHIAAQSGWYGHWRGLGRARMLANWFVAVPVFTRVFGYLPGQLGTGQHLPAGVAAEHDDAQTAADERDDDKRRCDSHPSRPRELRHQAFGFFSFGVGHERSENSACIAICD